ncbi:MAG: hypothetical protein KC503_24075 [Myxococcales bacterium]|nr:hypothetical protein [Myxococcales bacterium]
MPSLRRPRLLLLVLLAPALSAAGCGGASTSRDGAAGDQRIADALKFGDAKGGECQAAAECDDQNPCTLDTCNNGRCGHAPDPAATSCSDGNSCTSGDHCVNGSCVAGSPIANNDPCEGEVGYCGPTGCLQCQLSSHCADMDGNPCTVPECAQGGFCAEVPGNNGGSCDDGDACTDSDTCQAGSCAGTPKDCSLPPDACHSAGTCVAATGQCDYPILGGGPCDDNDSCTSGDYCNQQGQCVGVAQSGWQRKVSIDYQQNDPDNNWAALQTASYTVDGKITDVRVTGSSDDGGYCYAYWGTGHIERYRHVGSVGFYNVNGQLYIPIGGGGGLCPTNPPSFDNNGTVRICQGNADAGAFAYGNGTLGSGLAVGTQINVKARHVIGSGADAVHCYLEVRCP